VIQQTKEPAEAAQTAAAVAEAGANLEHRPGVLGGNLPVLDAERGAAQPRLHVLGNTQPLHQLGQQRDRLELVFEPGKPIGDDVARRHQRVQFTKAGVQRRAAAPRRRVVEDVVDDQRHVVKEL
jgi:hypothetical protein